MLSSENRSKDHFTNSYQMYYQILPDLYKNIVGSEELTNVEKRVKTTRKKLEICSIIFTIIAGESINQLLGDY